MDQGPLVSEQIDAGARFLIEFQKYCPVQLAFWLKDAERGRWFLYIASDQITDQNFDKGYGEVVRIAQALHDSWFDMFQVKLIGIDHPLAKAVAEAQRLYPGRNRPPLRGRTIHWIEVEDVYVYPSPLVVPAGQGMA